MVQNKGDVNKFAWCGTVRPGHEENEVESSSSTTAQTGASWSIGAVGFMFGGSAASASSSSIGAGGFSFGGGATSFGAQSTAVTTAATASTGDLLSYESEFCCIVCIGTCILQLLYLHPGRKQVQLLLLLPSQLPFFVKNCDA
mmetsp:Transcript_22689/g.34914  ORF Transcript_22689/g.34914 Transcript_22689/m.34914 type:complete len:143 (+) Transcript_22689:524-952(+)